MKRKCQVCKEFTADFETLVCDPNQTWVWGWATCEIGFDFKVEIGTSIDSFIKWCENHSGSKIYFHNLKFDGEFILSWLLKNDFKYIKGKKERESKTFSTLITDLRAILFN